MSGTLTFASGEREKTVSVPILDDAIDEGAETFKLKLRNAQGAWISDAEATGTITNSDPLQKMWLSRFGRTVASHVVDAVSDRLSGPLTGAQVTVGGQTVDLAATEDEVWLGETMTSLARALGASEAPEPVAAPGRHRVPTAVSFLRWAAFRYGQCRAASCCSAAPSTSPRTAKARVRILRPGAG